MSNAGYLYGSVLVGVLLAVIVWLLLDRRFRKPSPYYATLEAAPGRSKIRFVRDGVPMVDLILVEIRRDMNGGSAQFEDYTRFMEARRFR